MHLPQVFVGKNNKEVVSVQDAGVHTFESLVEPKFFGEGFEIKGGIDSSRRKAAREKARSDFARENPGKTFDSLTEVQQLKLDVEALITELKANAEAGEVREINSRKNLDVASKSIISNGGSPAFRVPKLLEKKVVGDKIVKRVEQVPGKDFVDAIVERQGGLTQPQINAVNTALKQMNQQGLLFIDPNPGNWAISQINGKLIVQFPDLDGFVQVKGKTFNNIKLNSVEKISDLQKQFMSGEFSATPNKFQFDAGGGRFGMEAGLSASVFQQGTGRAPLISIGSFLGKNSDGSHFALLEHPVKKGKKSNEAFIENTSRSSREQQLSQQVSDVQASLNSQGSKEPISAQSIGKSIDESSAVKRDIDESFFSENPNDNSAPLLDASLDDAQKSFEISDAKNQLPGSFEASPVNNGAGQNNSNQLPGSFEAPAVNNNGAGQNNGNQLPGSFEAPAVNNGASQNNSNQLPGSFEASPVNNGTASNNGNQLPGSLFQ